MFRLTSSLVQSTMKFALQPAIKVQSSRILNMGCRSLSYGSSSDEYVTTDSDSDSDFSHDYAGPFVKEKAPFFEGQAVVDKQFKTISLNDFAGKYLVLFFYPLDFTFVCPTELIAFSDRIDEFKAIDCHVVGCSCDSHFTHLGWINTPRANGGLGELKYPLLADFTKDTAAAYNVLLKNEGIPLRALFIIDPQGVIRQMTVNDLPVGRSVDETLRLVKAFQFVDKHGEVCPANWQPNSPTIKPSPDASKEYFGKVNK